MTAVAIVCAVLVLIALLRVGVNILYNTDGFTVRLRVGPFSLIVFPGRDDPKSVHKKEAKKAKRKKRKERLAKLKPVEKPGSYQTFKVVLSVIKTASGRLRRRLLIKELTVYYTAAGSDPSMTALSFGAANAVFTSLEQVLSSAFTLKKCDFRTSFDFNTAEQGIYVNATISLALWDVIYIVSAIAPLIKQRLKPKSNSSKTF